MGRGCGGGGAGTQKSDRLGNSEGICRDSLRVPGRRRVGFRVLEAAWETSGDWRQEAGGK